MSVFDQLKQRLWQKIKEATPSLPVGHAETYGSSYSDFKGMYGQEPAEGYPREFVPPPNPGKFEDLTRESKEVLSVGHETFEGLKLEIGRNYTEGFGVNHQVTMGEKQQGKPPASYMLMSHWTNKISTVFGMMNTEGELRGRFIHDVSPNLNVATGVQISREKPNEENTSFDTELNYKGSDFTTSVRFNHQTAPQGEQTMTSVSYSQGITRNLAIGIESAAVPSEYSMTIFLAGKYRGVDAEGRDWVASGLVSTIGVAEAAYTHTVTPKLRMSTTLALQPGQMPGAPSQAMWTVGYSYNFHNQITVKGSLTNLKIAQAVMEEHLNESMGIMVSGKINWPKNQYQFGLGFQLGLQ